MGGAVMQPAPLALTPYGVDGKTPLAHYLEANHWQFTPQPLKDTNKA
jgi:hypothetical protein